VPVDADSIRRAEMLIDGCEYCHEEMLTFHLIGFSRRLLRPLYGAKGEFWRRRLNQTSWPVSKRICGPRHDSSYESCSAISYLCIDRLFILAGRPSRL
jgi:hypothetical protein